ncbi:hypothetical protein HY967_04535 [Candidatus Jorgensenbacteria bacterium]|nr:hypothetical protein [Candidatus Jorgensenbacteria bacterium]
MDWVSFLQKFFSAPQLKASFFAAKLIFIFLDIVLVILFIYVARKVAEFRPKLEVKIKTGKRQGVVQKNPVLIRQWQAILNKSIAAPPQSHILGIIDADKFVDEVLKKMGIKGEHMADRLERMNTWDLKSIDKLWQAHRVRNELVHQPDFDISSVDVKEVMEIYESFLKEIGVL